MQYRLRFPITFPADYSGNLGPVHVETPQLIAPSMIGLAVDASGIAGGGFLAFDEPNQRYTGALSLRFGEISLSAVALITTRLPDGSDGFALLVSIGATFTEIARKAQEL